MMHHVYMLLCECVYALVPEGGVKGWMEERSGWSRD